MTKPTLCILQSAASGSVGGYRRVALNVDKLLFWFHHLLRSFKIFLLQSLVTYGPRREKTCLRGVANNTGADQPAHPRSLISAFVIRFFESIMSKLATGESSTV